MAAEGILTEILRKLASGAAQEIGLAINVEADMRNLQDTLAMIVAVKDDAVGRIKDDGYSAENSGVGLWLDRLTDAAYDADDILDDFLYEAIRRHEERQQSNKIDKMQRFFSYCNQLLFNFKMAKKIKDINQVFNRISKDKNRFNLRVTNTSRQSTDYEQESRQTSSFVFDPEIIGRENDLANIVDLLITTTASTSSSSNFSQLVKISVVSIVGLGGIGKTALAQLTYKDAAVVKHFELRIWFCFPSIRQLDLKRLLREILESITGAKCDVSSMEMLVRIVHEKLSGKKFLLVLDDMWDVGADRWETIKTWLMVGAEGSKILVTTRSGEVASLTQGTIPPYNLQLLSENDCWDIVKQRAFSPGGAVETVQMVKVGRMVAKKCCGLPLTARLLGSLMHSKNEEDKWLSLANNLPPKLLNNFYNVVQLSYNHLPSHLKRCFAYCSLFRKNQEINREDLIQLWMAEGFLPSEEETKISLEDVGNEYLNTLLQNSFFHDVRKDEFGNIKTCQMHDHIHDFAGSFSKEFCRGERSRRVRGTFQEEVPVLRPKLRTLLLAEADCLNYEQVKSVFRHKLRVLDMSGLSLPKLPASFAKLKHLRYLDLSFSLALQELHDESIIGLYQLQTLKLRFCVNFQKLPRNIGTLISLRHLDLTSTKIVELPESFTKLDNLRTLNMSFCSSFRRLPEDFGSLRRLKCLDLSGTGMVLDGLPESVKNIQQQRDQDFEIRIS